MENLNEVLSSLITIIVGLIIRHFEKKKLTQNKDVE
jgi:hypothetical protein